MALVRTVNLLSIFDVRLSGQTGDEVEVEEDGGEGRPLGKTAWGPITP